MVNPIRHPNRKTNVVFDLGNVILNWNVDLILESLSVENDEKHLLRNELFYHQDWLDLDHGTQSEAEVVSNICQRSSLRGHIVETAVMAAKNSLSPISESLSLIQEISDGDMEMYCLSNMSRETYQHIKDQAFFESFSGIVISGIEKCMKPDEKIFHLLIDRYKLDPGNTVFIDDSLPNIDTANRLGITGFHFKRSDNCYSKLRDLLF